MRLKTLIMKGKMSAMGRSMDVEMVSTQEDEFFMQISMPGMTIMKTAFDGESGYNEQQGQRKEMTPEEVEQTKLTSGVFLELKDASSFDLVAIESTEDGDAYVIQTTEKTKSFYSIETGLKIKDVEVLEQMGQTMESTTKYGDYKTVEGIMFPHLMTQSVGPQNFDIKFEEVLVNQEIPEDKFQ